MKLEFEVVETAKQLPVRQDYLDNLHAYEIGLHRWVYVSVDMVRDYPTCYPYWTRTLPNPKEAVSPFITDWRLLEVGVTYWMIDRADPDDRDIIEILVKNTKDETIYTCIAMHDGELVRFRENTHVFYPAAEAPRPPKDLLFFED
jgi:hypothetical protein